LRFILKLFFRLAVLGLLLAATVAAIGYYYPEKILCVDSGKNVSADVIIVLGGGQHERPQRAAELFGAHAAPRIIVSGAGDDEINRQLLIQAGVPAAAIEVEGKSATTRENAEFTVRRLRAEQLRSAIVVTSWYHSRRALMTFEHFAPELKFYSRPSYYGFDKTEWQRTSVGRHMWWEFLKLPGYWLRYGVNPF
jgi:uncharacterized SAM-binding protein YcdF (DUF218 family)